MRHLIIYHTSAGQKYEYMGTWNGTHIILRKNPEQKLQQKLESGSGDNLWSVDKHWLEDKQHEKQ